MTINYEGAVSAIIETLEYNRPDNEATAIDLANEALHEYVDTGLTYTADVLELWDGSTAEEIDLANYDNLMDAVVASTYMQVKAEFNDAIFDGLDEYIGGGNDNDAADRDEALWAMNG